MVPGLPATASLIATTSPTTGVFTGPTHFPDSTVAQDLSFSTALPIFFGNSWRRLTLVQEQWCRVNSCLRITLERKPCSMPWCIDMSQMLHKVRAKK